MKQENKRIAFDLDDTMNWLSHEIMVRSGVETPLKENIPVFSDIKKAVSIINDAKNNNLTIDDELLKDFPHISLKFLKTREECFNDPQFFSAPPYGLAYSMINMAKSEGYEPTICTKTLSNHPKFAEVTAAKMVFWKKYFSDLDMMIATGVKCIDAIALVDDLDKNCLAFNKKDHRPTLVWNHKTGTEELLNDFYKHCNDYSQYLDSETKNTVHYNFIVEKNGDKVRTIQALRDDEEVEDAISGGTLIKTIDLENNKFAVLHLYLREINNVIHMGELEVLRNKKDTLNSIIFNNFNI